MKNTRCIHPRRANKIVKEFIATLYNESVDFALAITKGKVVNYAAWGDVAEDEEVMIFIPNWRKADFEHDKGGKLFRKDFVQRCARAKGFSDVTISVLHEVGHTMTNQFLPKDYDRKIEFEKLKSNLQAKTNKEITLAYFQMQDEVMATNWAIDWLNDAQNRKIAKKFEKKFWACFAADQTAANCPGA